MTRTGPLVPPDTVRRRYSEVLPATDAAALDMLFAMRSGMQALDRTLSRWLGADALSPGRYQILATLWAQTRAVPQREIVSALQVSRANVSVLVEALRKEGHVSVLPDPDSRRQVLVELTSGGRALADRLIRETAGGLRKSLDLRDDELAALTTLLGRIATVAA